MKQIHVTVLFGGRSPEHDVSLESAFGILSRIDRKKYRVQPVKISREGRWHLIGPETPLACTADLDRASGQRVMLGDPTLNGFLLIGEDGNTAPLSTDVIFPVLHGPFGEDGTIQGLASLSGIPCVGAGVLGSALGMDKVMMKQLFIQNDLETTDFIWFLRSAWQKEPEAITRGVNEAVGYPCFIKPANAGSSVGISKVHDESGLNRAVDHAAGFDRKIIVEKAVNAREIECAVLGNDAPQASVPGEIIPCNDFYDYDAKYIDDRSRIVIPADIPDDVAERIRFRAVAAFKAVDCAGLARVDFLLERDTNRIVLNEINTIPGFTPISMYAKMWEAGGIGYTELIDRLIGLAVERHQDIIQSKFYR
ncbi:D-alanine--D-alanine ligase [bacterium]|nr:D-alanine--D-alanine ligase [bacterium]